MSSFDFVIVGGGTAGCILANRLTESGRHSVLLLEAGEEPRSPWIAIPAGFSKLLVNKRYNWQFQTEAEENTRHRIIAVPRGKGLGGSTLINGMIYVRGQAGDYDAWSTAGARGWSYKDVEPYFRRIENYQGSALNRGHAGPMFVEQVRERYVISDAFLQAAQDEGIPFNEDYNASAQYGVGYYQVTQRAGRRWSAYDGYLKPALGRRGLEIQTQAHVTRLELHGKRCVGVTYVKHGHQVRVTAGREVILSAGAVQTPQLMEISGIGRPDIVHAIGGVLRHPLGGVGENYIDHFATRMNWRVRNTVTINEMARGWRLALQVSRYFLGRRGILTLGTGLANAFIKTRPDLRDADAQYFFMHASYANAADRILDRQPGMTIGVSQLRPESVGSIHARSLDPLAAPSIRPNFLSSSVDQECIVRGMRIARDIVGRPSMRHYIAEEMNPGRHVQASSEWLDFARSNGQTIYHPIGTCRMGEDRDAVVDLRLRVHGIDGLRIVDASVMPRMVSGNIQAAVMMVAERGADFVLEDQQRLSDPEIRAGCTEDGPRSSTTEGSASDFIPSGTLSAL